MAWVTPPTWKAGEEPTGAMLNARIRDQQLVLDPAVRWVSYTPTWAGGSPSLGDGFLQGMYARLADLVLVRIVFIAGTTTTFGSGTLSFTAPVTVDGTGPELAVDGNLTATMYDDSANNAYQMRGGLTSGALTAYRVEAGGAAYTAWTSTGPYFTMAARDMLIIDGGYVV